MSVPETAMNKNNAFVFRQNNVRLSGQVFPVQPEPVSEDMKSTANRNFRLRVSRTDSGHVPASLFFAQDISHQSSGSASMTSFITSAICLAR